MFESGAGVAAVQCLNVTIIGDNIIEGGVSESFSVEAVARPPDVIQGTTTVNITIQGDGDGKPNGRLDNINNVMHCVLTSHYAIPLAPANGEKTMHYSPWFSARIWKSKFLPKQHIIRKGISRGAEWCKFQLCSTFQ